MKTYLYFCFTENYKYCFYKELELSDSLRRIEKKVCPQKGMAAAIR
jgi:hypothetical protein